MFVVDIEVIFVVYLWWEVLPWLWRVVSKWWCSFPEVRDEREGRACVTQSMEQEGRKHVGEVV